MYHKHNLFSEGVVEEHICGRRPGFVIDEKNKVMYVADAYLGIWKVNLVTDKKQLFHGVPACANRWTSSEDF